MATAFELTRPEQEGRYEVTIYQVGWRLGGKGASGRGPAGRIEEHGLHLWMGFYENAFRLLRECYAELDRKPGTCPIVDWLDAFSPAPYAGLADRSARGDWLAWTALLPPGGGLPGDPGRRPQRWTISEYLARSISLIASLLERYARPGTAASHANEAPRLGLLDGSPAALLQNTVKLLEFTPVMSLSVFIHLLHHMRDILGAANALASDQVQQIYERLETVARDYLKALLGRDDELRRVWELIDILLAVVGGSLRSQLLTDPRGFDAIDHYDCREWLQKNGASAQSVNGAFVRGLHDLALAYENGAPDRMRFAAGQGLRGSFRAFFTYRGSFFWKMRAGMGDVVFAPFYEVLRRRGVRFEFFHRLRHVRLDRASTRRSMRHIAVLEFDVQAATVSGGAYQPLVDVRGLPCWPSEPDWTQLVGGQQLARQRRNFESHDERHRAGTRTLRVTRDFDFVVLAIGLGAIRGTCRDLIAASDKWRAMVDRVATVPTQAFQVWLREDMKTLGWREPTLSSLSAFVHPFTTWADMTHLAAREDWPDAPRAIAYFCGVLEDAEGSTPVARRKQVRDAAVRFLNHDIGRLWPGAERRTGAFRWDLLVDPETRRTGRRTAAGPQRFDSQFWTANVNPSDRYVQSLPGTSAFRISPLDEHFDNLTVAGDWTACSLDIGCVEAAVMSGRLAAHALSQLPALDDIVGFDHP